MNLVPSLVSRSSRGKPTPLAPGHNTDGHVVAPALVKRYAKGTDSDATDCMIVNALDCQAGGPDDNSAQGNELVTHTLTSAGFDASEADTGRGTPIVADTLLAHGKEGGRYDKHPLTAVAFSENQRGEVLEHNYSHQLTKGGGKAGQGYPAARVGGAVRRLTPTECERLQSWPDGWTLTDGPSLADVPQAAARVVDPHDPQPDGQRYAAAGDGVTSNVAEWIGRRIITYEQGGLADAA